MEHNLSDMRRHYEAAELSEENTPASPYFLFNTWFAEATASTIIEPNAMTLATASKEGKPSARIVLLKEINKDGLKIYNRVNNSINAFENPLQPNKKGGYKTKRRLLKNRPKTKRVRFAI